MHGEVVRELRGSEEVSSSAERCGGHGGSVADAEDIRPRTTDHGLRITDDGPAPAAVSLPASASGRTSDIDPGLRRSAGASFKCGTGTMCFPLSRGTGERSEPGGWGRHPTHRLTLPARCAHLPSLKGGPEERRTSRPCTSWIEVQGDGTQIRPEHRRSSDHASISGRTSDFGLLTSAS